MTLKDALDASALGVQLSYQSSFCRICVGFIITVVAPTLIKSSRNLKANFESSEVTLRNLFITTPHHSEWCLILCEQSTPRHYLTTVSLKSANGPRYL